MKIAALAVGAAIVGIGVAAVKSAGDMEMLATQFEVMLGSAEKATKMMDQLEEFSARTPFQLPDLAKGTQNLLAFGVAEENVLDAMRMLGDTAGGSREKLMGLVLAYGKVQVKGKASMEELNMIAEKGVPIFTTLMAQIGVGSKEAFFKMVSAGKIGKDAIKQAFRTMTSEGGIFFQGMKKSSETFQGVLSTLKDVINITLASLGKSMLPVLKEYASKITDIVLKVREWVKLNKDKLQKSFEKMIKTIIKIVKIIYKLRKIILALIIALVSYTVISKLVLAAQMASVIAYKLYAVATTAATVAQRLFNISASKGVVSTALLNTNLKNIAKTALSVVSKLAPIAIAIAAITAAVIALNVFAKSETKTVKRNREGLESIAKKFEDSFERTRPTFDDFRSNQINNNQRNMNVEAPINVSVTSSAMSGNSIGKEIGAAIQVGISKEFRKLVIAGE